jgi:TonB-dependent starch-binding outer membrane protein SusC
MAKKLLMLCLFLWTSAAIAQNRTVSGTVTSAEDGSPLPGASITVKGTTTGTSTDADGKYSISVPTGSSTLVFSFIGLVSKEIQVNNQNTLNVALQSDSKALTELVVVGYGTQSKRDLTGSISSIAGK